MSATAIVMMIIAMLVLWGGLALAIVNINRSGRQEPDTTRRDL
jgi:hypothetical protein